MWPWLGFRATVTRPPLVWPALPSQLIVCADIEAWLAFEVRVQMVCRVGPPVRKTPCAHWATRWSTVVPRVFGALSPAGLAPRCGLLFLRSDRLLAVLSCALGREGMIETGTTKGLLVWSWSWGEADLMCGCFQVLSYSVELRRSEADGITCPLQLKPTKWNV